MNDSFTLSSIFNEGFLLQTIKSTICGFLKNMFTPGDKRYRKRNIVNGVAKGLHGDRR